MWWEERCWLLLDVEWEAGRQKQGSPGYCCSVGGYQQLGSPLSSWHCNWAEGAMDGTTALPLRLSSSHPPPFLCLLSFLLLLLLFSFSHLHNLSLFSNTSPLISRSLDSVSSMGFPRSLTHAGLLPSALEWRFPNSTVVWGKTFSPVSQPLHPPACSLFSFLSFLFILSFMQAFSVMDPYPTLPPIVHRYTSV